MGFTGRPPLQVWVTFGGFHGKFEGNMWEIKGDMGKLQGHIREHS